MSADMSPGLAQLVTTSQTAAADEKFQVPKKPATTVEQQWFFREQCTIRVQF